MVNQVIFDPTSNYIWEPNYQYDKLLINNKISAWYFNFDLNKKNKTILFCHGNYGNISYKDYVIELCKKYNLNLLIFDYQGYGKSKGFPSQHQICQDGTTVYNYLCDKYHICHDDIIIWGESLGGAVAAYIASLYPCHRLILMSTFSSLDDIIWDQKTGPIPRALMYLLSKMTDMLKTKHRIKSIKCPIIIVHSTEDDIIPFKNALSLYNHISHNNKLLIIIKGGHSTPEISASQLIELLEFCGIKNQTDIELNDIIHMIGQIRDKYICHK